MPRLAGIDQATGLPVRKQPAQRYGYPHPGDMVHVDIKKTAIDGLTPMQRVHNVTGKYT